MQGALSPHMVRPSSELTIRKDRGLRGRVGRDPSVTPRMSFPLSSPSWPGNFVSSSRASLQPCCHTLSRRVVQGPARLGVAARGMNPCHAIPDHTRPDHGKLADQRTTIHLGRPLARSGHLDGIPESEAVDGASQPYPLVLERPAVDATGERGVACGPKCCWAWEPIPDI